MLRWGALLAVIFCAADTGLMVQLAQAAECDGALSEMGLQVGGTSKVAAVPDGDTLILANGDMVRLTGIQAPKLSLGRADMQDWPLAVEARDHLADLIVGQDISLWHGGADRDRHHRILAHGETEGGTWLQADMVQAGLARVYSFPDNRACIRALLDVERRSRAARKGLWALDEFAVLDAGRVASIADREGEFSLVEGRVLNAERAGSRIYLNFGRSWRTDFTLVVGRRAQSLFEDSDLDLLALENHLIRARGYVELSGGPMIEVTHPEQIEVVARP